MYYFVQQRYLSFSRNGSNISNTLPYYECGKALEGEIIQIQITYNSTPVMLFFREFTSFNKIMCNLQYFLSSFIIYSSQK